MKSITITTRRVIPEDDWEVYKETCPLPFDFKELERTGETKTYAREFDNEQVVTTIRLRET